MKKDQFGEILLRWYQSNFRDLPWNKTKDPYKIWVSEVILQQTRVDQGLPYYTKFINRYPTIADLASADESEILNLWQGLGYYSRARNMHFAAKQIVSDFEGVFPSTYEHIISLKGIGKYSAAAIASFAYDLAYPVVDGNVQRVLSRVFGIGIKGVYKDFLKKVEQKVQSVFTPEKSADFNRAIMNFGALICTPKKAQCHSCVFAKNCVAYTQNLVDQLPPKKQKIKVKNRFFSFLYFEFENHTVLHQRTEKDIWEKLFEFPMIDTSHEQPLSNSKIRKEIFSLFAQDIPFTIINQSKLKQRLTHQLIHARIYHIRLNTKYQPRLSPEYKAVPRNQLDSYAFPKLLDQYIQDYIEIANK